MFWSEICFRFHRLQDLRGFFLERYRKHILFIYFAVNCDLFFKKKAFNLCRKGDKNVGFILVGVLVGTFLMNVLVGTFFF